MRVTIEHGTKKVSLFKSAPTINFTVEFTDVEKAAIKKAGLTDYVVHHAPIHSLYPERMQGPVYVSSLLKGPYLCQYETLAAARADEPNLRQAFKNLKDTIDANAAPIKEKETFEL